jgi:hypothetical protein
VHPESHHVSVAQFSVSSRSMSDDNSAEYSKALEGVSLKTYDRDFLKEFELLPSYVRHLYAAHWCVAEVYNGGFFQFFENYTGVVAPEAVQAFTAFGMYQCSESVTAAMRKLGPRYPRGRLVRNLLLRIAQVLRFTTQERLFDAQDSAFYRLHDRENGGFVAAGVMYVRRCRS